jgi:hypothetical protein
MLDTSAALLQALKADAGLSVLPDYSVYDALKAVSLKSYCLIGRCGQAVSMWSIRQRGSAPQKFQNLLKCSSKPKSGVGFDDL